MGFHATITMEIRVFWGNKKYHTKHIINRFKKKIFDYKHYNITNIKENITPQIYIVNFIYSIFKLHKKGLHHRG